MISESDFNELKSVALTGVTVGIGSQVLIFENGVSLLIQCPFKCVSRGNTLWGHGEEIETAPLIFYFLNQVVESARFEADGVIALDFGCVGSLVVVPDLDGMESYVLTTRLGIYPFSSV